MQPSPQLFVLIHFSYNCPKYVRKKKKPLKISGFCRVGRIALAHYPKLIPKAPADRTTARTCQEQKKPDYCRAFLSGWQDCFSPTTPKLNPKAPADRTTARTCQEQKKPDYCRAFLSAWLDCFSPTTSKLIPNAPADRTTARTCHEQQKPDYCRAFLSGWQDSNLRPPHPKCGAIPGYATPRLGITFLCGTNIQHILLLSRLYF